MQIKWVYEYAHKSLYVYVYVYVYIYTCKYIHISVYIYMCVKMCVLQSNKVYGISHGPVKGPFVHQGLVSPSRTTGSRILEKTSPEGPKQQIPYGSKYISSTYFGA